AQLADRPKLNRSRRACLGAGWLQAVLQAVVAQGALLCGARGRVDLDDAERTGRNTVATAIADVGLNDHRVKLGTDDGPRRAHLQAPGLHAVFTHFAHHQPAPVAAVGANLLDELDLPPGEAVQPTG